jgi:hypothetical protein
MADITSTFASLSSTESSNGPSGATAVGTGLDDNLRMLGALIAANRDASGWGGLKLTSVAGANTVTGSVAAQGSVTMAPTAYATGMRFHFIPAGTNTGATTLNVNSIGAKNIYAGNSALVGGELHANIPVVVEYDGTQFQLLGPVFRQPTSQTFTSGSGTYTTPTGATRLRVRMVGGGGGGGASSSNNGSGGGNTTFSTYTASGGAGGVAASGNGGAGGAAAGGTINIPGGSGQGGSTTGAGTTFLPGGQGGSSAFGGGGAGGNGNNGAGAAATNSGGGGGGAGGVGAGASGGGGGAGGYVEAFISGPAASYSYAVGAAGSGGSAGGIAGANGAAGIIIVEEFYN